MLRVAGRRKLDLEQIRAALLMKCPLCGAEIGPEKQKRVDAEQMECPNCRNLFKPAK